MRQLIFYNAVKRGNQAVMKKKRKRKRLLKLNFETMGGSCVSDASKFTIPWQERVRVPLRINMRVEVLHEVGTFLGQHPALPNHILPTLWCCATSCAASCLYHALSLETFSWHFVHYFIYVMLSIFVYPHPFSFSFLEFEILPGRFCHCWNLAFLAQVGWRRWQDL